MFICNECHTQSKVGESSYLIVTKTREKLYYYTLREDNKQKRFVERTDETEPINRTTKGSEIVQEKKVCGDCYEQSRTNR